MPAPNCVVLVLECFQVMLNFRVEMAFLRGIDKFWTFSTVGIVGLDTQYSVFSLFMLYPLVP